MKKENGFIGVVVIILVVLVLLGGAIYFFFLSPKAPKPSIPGAPQGQNMPPQQGSSGPNGANPLQNHDTYITFSKDGKTWNSGTLVKKGASVPELIQLTHDVGTFKSGDLLIYFVDASTMVGPGSEGISIERSTNLGKTWTSAGQIKVTGKVNKGAAVDPSIVQLDDGTLRLYFFGSEITQGDPAQASGPHKVYSATSTDGIDFTVESGVRFESNQLTDPDVVYYNGTWYMYYSAGSTTKLATSSDGLTFTSKAMTGGSVGGVPGAVSTGSSVLLFGCSQGISEASSTNGVNFNIIKQDIIKTSSIICDPSPIKLTDGTYAMAYKIETGGQTQNQKPPPPNPVQPQ